MPAAWAAWVIEAVEKWATLEGEPDVPDGWRCAGRAVPAPEPELLALDTRDRPLHPDLLAQLCLAGEDGPDAGRWHPVAELRVAHGVVLVREPDGLPRHSRYVWVRTRSRRALLDALRSGLAATGAPAPLAEALAAGSPAGRPDPAVPVPAGLTAPQADAYRSCFTPGLRLVWAAPGTGRTHVIGHAARDLVAAGRRVLLVSPTDAALDAALLAALPGLPGGPGTAVRVGPPHDAGVAAHPDVRLDLLAARAAADVDRRRARVARQLDELAAVDADVDDLITRLAGYDDPTYRAAAARVAADEEAAGLEPGLRTAQARVARVRDDVAATLDGAASLEAELAKLAPARAAFAKAASLDGEADRAEREVRRRDLGVATVEAVPAHAGGPLARWRRGARSRSCGPRSGRRRRRATASASGSPRTAPTPRPSPRRTSPRRTRGGCARASRPARRGRSSRPPRPNATPPPGGSPRCAPSAPRRPPTASWCAAARRSASPSTTSGCAICSCSSPGPRACAPGWRPSTPSWSSAPASSGPRRRTGWSRTRGWSRPHPRARACTRRWPPRSSTRCSSTTPVRCRSPSCCSCSAGPA
ncbi:hypothetical protein BJF78_33560 [Pseudonocardia sp. CNS-139]|nr:hypothetical protein BJF78_33560 [Pseudonocardia sp. CNS-139]